MSSITVIIGIFLVSLMLGFIKYGSIASAYTGKPWQLKFVELWNDFINFFITGLIGYYFVLFRLPVVSKGEVLEVSDFALFIIFMLGLFGHLSVMSKNITEGINAILKRVLES